MSATLSEYRYTTIKEISITAGMKKGRKRDELHRAIRAIADDLRGAVDGWDFKNYVLGSKFLQIYRRISLII